MINCLREMTLSNEISVHVIFIHIKKKVDHEVLFITVKEVKMYAIR